MCRPNAENNNGLVNATVALLVAGKLAGYLDACQMVSSSDKRTYDKSPFLAIKVFLGPF